MNVFARVPGMIESNVYRKGDGESIASRRDKPGEGAAVRILTMIPGTLG